MITECIFNVLFSFLSILFEILPDVDFNIEQGGIGTITSVLRMACYFLPMGTVAAILSVVVALGLFRVAVSVVKTIWQVLPFF